MATILIGRVLSAAQDSVTAVQGGAGSAPWPVKVANTLVTEPFNYIALGYNVQNLLSQVVYRNGGPSGPIVATVGITYVGRLMATISRT